MICLSIGLATIFSYQIFKKNNRNPQSAGYRVCPNCLLNTLDKDINELNKVIKLVDHSPEFNTLPKGCKRSMNCEQRTNFGSACCTIAQNCVWLNKKKCTFCPFFAGCNDYRISESCCEFKPYCFWDHYDDKCRARSNCLEHQSWAYCTCNHKTTCDQPTAECCVKHANDCRWNAYRQWGCNM